MMDIIWPSDVTDTNTWVSHSVHIPVMAYMDDTIFIDSSKKRIQASIDLATEFYNINDIFINSNKCDLVVINSHIPIADRFIHIGQQRSKIQATLKEIRYLGIWIACNHQQCWHMTFYD